MPRTVATCTQRAFRRPARYRCGPTPDSCSRGLADAGAIARADWDGAASGDLHDTVLSRRSTVTGAVILSRPSSLVPSQLRQSQPAVLSSLHTTTCTRSHP